MAKHNIHTILDKGIELIRLNGYHNTGIREILKACNMPKGSFYHLFESKEDFVIKAIAQFDEENTKIFEKNFANDSLSYFDRIKNHFQLHINWYVDNDYQVGCLLGNLSTEIAGTNEAISNKIAKVYDSWSAGLASFIKLGQNAGEINNTIPSLDIANYLFNSFNGALGRMKVERSGKPLEQFLSINMELIRNNQKIAV